MFDNITAIYLYLNSNWALVIGPWVNFWYQVNLMWPKGPGGCIWCVHWILLNTLRPGQVGYPFFGQHVQMHFLEIFHWSLFPRFQWWCVYTPIRDNAVAHINLPIMYSWCSVHNILISFKRFASIVTLYRFLCGYHSKNYIINSLTYMCLNLMGRRVALSGFKSYIFDFDNFMACFLSSPPRLVVIFWNEVFPRSQWVSVDSTVLTWPYPKHRSTNIIPIGYADYQRRHNISSRAIFTNMV